MVVLKTSLSLVRPLQTLGRIAQRCDGVCKLFGNAEHGGRLYLVMKLYAGSLDEHLRQVFPPSTFSRTVWRLYGGSKGLVMRYYLSLYALAAHAAPAQRPQPDKRMWPHDAACRSF